MGHLFGSWRYSLAAALVTCLVGALAWQIATRTAYDAHPDERQHVDAFCYFQVRAWMPPVNADGLAYGAYGDSRVYGGEVVYWVYGRAAAIANSARPLPAPASAPVTHLGAQIAQCQPEYLTFRLFNVALLVGTLVCLFAAGRRQAWAAAIALGMICLPQVIYVYSYANSDAWALSCCLALLSYTLAERRPLSSPAKALLLGLLAALVLLSKQTVWIALPFAGAVIAYRLWQDWRAGAASGRVESWRAARNAIVATAAFVLLIAPTTIIYPLSHGGHPSTSPAQGLREQLRQVQELRAEPGYKPSNPYAPGYRLRAKGAGFDQIALNLHWLATSAKSFYGIFGYMDVRLPTWVYLAALAIGAANGLLSLWVAWRNWKALPDSLRLVLSLGPAVIGALVGASMYNSWTGDYQPQGRYLFVAIVPLGIWLWGLMPWEKPWLRAVRLISALGLVGLCAGVLWLKVL